jgi:exopolysaccharide biosynthesis polyprenyl glycosylphosphotransferase
MGFNYRQILIVGRNRRAGELARSIRDMPELGLRVVGFVDALNGEARETGDCSGDLLGTIEDLPRIIKEQVVDEVYITLPLKSFYSEAENLIRLCETVGLEAKIPTNLFDLRKCKSTISHELDVAVIDLYTSPKMDIQMVLKRLMDMVIASFLLVLLLPLFVLVAFLIKLTSQGPVLFRQERVGYNGRSFTLYKFRTMVHNAEVLKDSLLALNEMDGPVFKIRKDPRITKVGSVLRKTSVDELPQLINVLKGDMSLVGPRPPVPREVIDYALSDRRRLSMKPGMTGIWQISGSCRNDISFERWMEMDKEYIDQWSLWLDIKILMRTIPAVIKCSGA